MSLCLLALSTPTGMGSCFVFVLYKTLYFREFPEISILSYTLVPGAIRWEKVEEKLKREYLHLLLGEQKGPRLCGEFGK